VKPALQQALHGLRVELLLLACALLLGLILLAWLPELAPPAQLALLASALALSYFALRLGLDAWVLRRWLRATDLPQALQAFDDTLRRWRLRPAPARSLPERLHGLARLRRRALLLLALHTVLLMALVHGSL